MHTAVSLDVVGVNAIARALMAGTDPWLATRFPHQDITAGIIERRAREGASRQRLISLISTSMASVTLSDEQTMRLADLRDPKSVCVVTGQQIGLFGGPLYTILKIRSAVSLAASIAAQHNVAVVPVFWLEDNDHDAIEASTAVSTRADGTLQTTVLVDEASRIPVHMRTLTADDAARIADDMAAWGGQFADETRAHLASIYTAGRRWNDAFLDVLQPFLASWGVLVVRGSDVVAHGMHMPLVERDVAHPGVVRAMVDIASAELLERGYHAQATANDYSFFIHRNGERHRIEEAPPLDATFSPSVLSRPIVQDAILPSVASVLGAAEIAYHAQLTETYQWFGVTMPAIVQRHTATILDARTERLLQKLDREPAFYMRPWSDVERDIVRTLDAGIVPDDATITPLLAALIDPYRHAAQHIDATLIGSVEAAEASVKKSLEAVSGKLRSAMKRVHAEQMDRHRSVAQAIRPDGSPQERIICLGSFLARLGMEKLRSIVSEVCTTDRTTHTIIS